MHAGAFDEKYLHENTLNINAYIIYIYIIYVLMYIYNTHSDSPTWKWHWKVAQRGRLPSFTNRGFFHVKESECIYIYININAFSFLPKARHLGIQGLRWHAPGGCRAGLPQALATRLGSTSWGQVDRWPGVGDTPGVGESNLLAMASNLLAVASTSDVMFLVHVCESG